jgi:hypothetical protein
MVGGVMDKDTSRRGNHYVIDDRTGCKVWASDTSVEWTGIRVADKDQRHSQDFVKGRADRQKVPFGRPAAPLVFISAFDYGFDEGFDS